jgi:zinc-binding in reverse transcriptase
MASAYCKFIQDYPTIWTSLPNLWKLKAPLRVSVFIWLMFTNTTLTMNNLKRRWWQLVSICHMCFDVQFIREIHCYIHDIAKNHRIVFTNYRRWHYQLMLGTRENIYWRRMKVITFFVIWRERCTWIFRDEN